MINENIQQRLYPYIHKIVQQNGGEIIAIGGVADHLHILIENPSSLSIADCMRLVKTNSSKWIRETFETHKDFGWQTGYGAFTVSPSVVEEVIHYIENQQKHHETLTFDEEFITFLKRHQIEYDISMPLG